MDPFEVRLALVWTFIPLNVQRCGSGASPSLRLVLSAYDVAIRLERLQQRGGQTFKDLVNTVLRAGLDQLETPELETAQRHVYYLTPVALQPRLANIDNIAEVIAVAEGEGHR